MAKKETVYDVAFEVYELTKADVNTKHTIRKYIRENLKKTFQGKEWTELSELEKDRFIFIIIRDKMINNYMDKAKRYRLNRKIDKILNERLIRADIEIEKYNDMMSKIYDVYYKESDTDIEKMEAYKQFCNDLSDVNKFISIPTYDEWVIGAKRIYDYVMDFTSQTHMESNSEYRPATQSQIDHVIIKMILKIISDKLNMCVNISKIDECLSFLNNFQVEDFEELLHEYNPKLNLTKDEQNSIIEENKKYMIYKKMLEDLDFLSEQ